MIASKKWMDRYAALAEHVAQWSQDPTTKVGAVLVGRDRRKIALGYNGFPPGIADDDRLRDRPTKHMLIQHAERNVLDNAQFALAGATLITTRFPCHECAKSIISKGIECVASPPRETTTAGTDPVWATSSRVAEELLKEAGVRIEIY